MTVISQLAFERIVMGKLQRIQLSSRGPEVSRVVSGVWRLLDENPDIGTGEIRAYIETCLELGITTFDHADIYGGYGCEQAFGRVLKETPALKDNIEIITKCGIMLVDPARPENTVKYYDTSSAHVRSSVDTSLNNLSVDVIDVLLVHRPSPFCDYQDLARGLRDVLESGKVKSVGVSNFLPHQLSTLRDFLDAPLVTNQVELSLLQNSPFYDGTTDQCQSLKISPMAWSPLGGGEIFRADSEKKSKLNSVKKVAEQLGPKYDLTLDQLMLAWLLNHPSNVVPVIGTMKPDRLARSASAVGVVLDQRDWFQLLEAANESPVP